MSSNRICQNEKCNKLYDVNSRGADERFCSFECWETVNCGAPAVFEDTEAIKELSKFKS